MDAHETRTHAFVIRMWSERTEEEDVITWRGHITHVLSGKRRYIQELSTIGDFITPYLEDTASTRGGLPDRGLPEEI